MLMKTSRPECYIPLVATVSRDVRLVFARTRIRVARMLQPYTYRRGRFSSYRISFPSKAGNLMFWH
ncbi:hypothetical protein HD554DRAFT_2097015 [Boletus coccyginus]|nr:hypothetical protein HD554DRAFT_2097015 [Boletus coccyginus]